MWINLYLRVNNVLNTQNEINVYRTTGSAADDGWLHNSDNYREYYNRSGQQYIDMYRAVNLENGQSYLSYYGQDLYDSPRQIWLGFKITFAE